jgi:transposase-like protein
VKILPKNSWRDEMRKTGREEREQHIRGWQESGLSKTEYCRENGLKRSSFDRWFREHRGAEKSTDGFIEISVDRFKRREQTQSSECEIGVILTNGYRINVRKGFDQETFVTVLALLEAR